MRVCSELQHHLMVLVLRRAGVLKPLPVLRQVLQGVIAYLTTKGRGNPRLFINSEEEEITTLDHVLQYCLGNGIIGIDQNIEGLEPIEFKGEVNDFVFASSVKGMPKIETQIRNTWGNYRLRS